MRKPTPSVRTRRIAALIAGARSEIAKSSAIDNPTTATTQASNPWARGQASESWSNVQKVATLTGVAAFAWWMFMPRAKKFPWLTSSQERHERALHEAELAERRHGSQQPLSDLSHRSSPMAPPSLHRQAMDPRRLDPGRQLAEKSEGYSSSQLEPPDDAETFEASEDEATSEWIDTEDTHPR